MATIAVPNNAAPHHDGFRVSSTVAVLFSRLPVRLRDHVAFRHFFTPELDPTAHGICIKFFTLLIFYFTTVFRLEGRRRLYKEHNTPSAGVEFYAAHLRAQRVFKDVTTCYGIILSRYNVHSQLQYKVSHSFLIRGRREAGKYAVGIKEDSSLLTSVSAFSYAADEMIFYEHLFLMLTEVVRLAFSEDTKVQDAVTEQLGNIFRSPTFTFNDLRRSEKVSNLTHDLESKGLSLMENTQQLAELLTSTHPKMIAKYAIHQRSPFVANFLPAGGNSFMKYQRPRNNSLTKPPPTKNEKLYTVETKEPPFPIDHRAMVLLREFNERLERKRASLAAKRKLSLASETASHHKHGGTRQQQQQQQQTTQPIRSRPDSQLSGSALQLPPVRISGLTPEPLQPSHSGSMFELRGGGGGTGTAAGGTRQTRPHHPDADLPSVSPTPPLAHTPWKIPTNTSNDALEAMSFAERSMAGGGGGASMGMSRSHPNKTPQLTATQAREAKELAFHNILSTPLAEWSTRVSVSSEVEALFQAVVNGVPIGDLSVPKDIMLVYDDTGVLQVNRSGDPETV